MTITASFNFSCQWVSVAARFIRGCAGRKHGVPTTFVMTRDSRRFCWCS